jgi:hypothetical protein
MNTFWENLLRPEEWGIILLVLYLGKEWEMAAVIIDE